LSRTPARSLDQLPQRRQVLSRSLENLAHMREVVRRIDGQSNIGTSQRRGRGQLDDAEQL